MLLIPLLVAIIAILAALLLAVPPRAEIVALATKVASVH
jgi:hypothetical protein